MAKDMVDLVADVRGTEEYDYLVDHCKAIIGQRVKNSREELILGYAELGEEITKNPLYKKFSKDNQAFLEGLFTDIGVGKRNGYYAIEFYRYIEANSTKQIDAKEGWEKTAGDLEEGENISWSKIKTLYLSDGKESVEPTMSEIAERIFLKYGLTDSKIIHTALGKLIARDE
jgi:hypothetical protein